MKMVLPNRIRKGARFGFFSPSDPIYPRRIEFIQMALEIIREWGFQTEVISSNVLKEWSVLRSPQVRADEFHTKIVDPKVDALIATWGGKNSNDLLELLDYKLIREVHKPIIGSSDIAVLLNAISKKSGIVTYYGPNVLGKFNQTKEIGLPLLVENCNETINLFPDTSSESVKIIRPGQARGFLVGGSLGTFTLGLSGTDYMPNYDKTVFFFESASLDYFRIKQHLKNLILTGFGNNVVAVIVGATNQITQEGRTLFEEMLREIFPEKTPIITTELFGHGFYYNPTFPIGSEVSINTFERKFDLEPIRL